MLLNLPHNGHIYIVAAGNHTIDNGFQLQVSVRDTGIGMEEQDLERLFSPFSQVEESSTRRFGGTGLSGSICHGLVQAWGGNITVSSQKCGIGF